MTTRSTDPNFVLSWFIKFVILPCSGTTTEPTELMRLPGTSILPMSLLEGMEKRWVMSSIMLKSITSLSAIRSNHFLSVYQRWYKNLFWILFINLVHRQIFILFFCRSVMRDLVSQVLSIWFQSCVSWLVCPKSKGQTFSWWRLLEITQDRIQRGEQSLWWSLVTGKTWVIDF